MRIFKDQITFVKEKTDKLLSEFSSSQWFITPDVINSNLNWQIGHIILANYLHGIASLTGKNELFSKKVNVPDYIKFYGPNSTPSDFSNEKPSAKQLLEVYELTYFIILNSLDTVTPIDLESNTAIPNPSVNTKCEALLWLVQHQSWHCGQIATLNRVING